MYECIKEEWRIIPNISTHEISNLGNVRHKQSKKIRKPYIDRDGYLQVNIFVKPYIKTFKIHKLVALSFIPNPNRKEQINHINGIKTDNRVENLEWCSCRENIIHAHKLGLMNVDHLKNYYAKNRKMVAQIKNGEIIKVFPSIKDAAKSVGVLYSNITYACQKPSRTIKGFNWCFIKKGEEQYDV